MPDEERINAEELDMSQHITGPTENEIQRRLYFE
jgi:hypothetical protein